MLVNKKYRYWKLYIYHTYKSLEKGGHDHEIHYEVFLTSGFQLDSNFADKLNQLEGMQSGKETSSYWGICLKETWSHGDTRN